MMSVSPWSCQNLTCRGCPFSCSGSFSTWLRSSVGLVFICNHLCIFSTGSACSTPSRCWCGWKALSLSPFCFFLFSGATVALVLPSTPTVATGAVFTSTGGGLTSSVEECTSLFSATCLVIEMTVSTNLQQFYITFSQATRLHVTPFDRDDWIPQAHAACCERGFCLVLVVFCKHYTSNTAKSHTKWLRRKQRLRWKLWEQVCGELQHHHKTTGTTRTTSSSQCKTSTPMTTLTSTIAWCTSCVESAQSAHCSTFDDDTAHLVAQVLSNHIVTSIPSRARSLWLDLSLLPLLFLPALLRLLPLPRAVPWARQPDRHGKSAPLRCRGEWWHPERLHLSHSLWAQPPNLQRAQRLISPLLLHDPFHGPRRGWRDTRRDAHSGTPRTSRLLRTRRHASQSVVCDVRWIRATWWREKGRSISKFWRHTKHDQCSQQVFWRHPYWESGR